jgi:hypothetical protein
LCASERVVPGGHRHTCAGHPLCLKGKPHSIDNPRKRKPTAFLPCSRAHAEQLIDDLLHSKPDLLHRARPIPFVRIFAGADVEERCYASKSHVLLGEPYKLPQSPDETITLCNVAYQKPDFTTQHFANKKITSPPTTATPPPPPQVGDKRPQVQLSLVSCSASNAAQSVFTIQLQTQIYLQVPTRTLTSLSGYSMWSN